MKEVEWETLKHGGEDQLKAGKSRVKQPIREKARTGTGVETKVCACDLDGRRPRVDDPVLSTGPIAVVSVRVVALVNNDRNPLKVDATPMRRTYMSTGVPFAKLPLTTSRHLFVLPFGWILFETPLEESEGAPPGPGGGGASPLPLLTYDHVPERTPGSEDEPAAPGKVRKSKTPGERSNPDAGQPGHWSCVVSEQVEKRR